MSRTSPVIGVFDSGIGGITVLTELRKRLQGASFVYYGDTAHLPYGTKSPAQIQRLSRDCARRLREKGVDALVVACNTASSWAMEAIREEMGRAMPVFGVVEPGVEASLDALSTLARGGSLDGSVPILILATRATTQSGAYGKILRTILSGAGHASTPVLEQACPLLVPMIEEGWVDHEILHRTIQEYVSGYVASRRPGVAHLACTHYPWIHSAFERALPGWRVVNSAQAVAQAVARSEFWTRAQVAGGPGKIEWLFSDPDALPAFSQRVIQQMSHL